MIDNVIHVFMDWKIIKNFSARASQGEHLRDFQNVISTHDHVCDLRWVLDWEGWLEIWNLLLHTYIRNDEILTSHHRGGDKSGRYETERVPRTWWLSNNVIE